MGSFPLLRNPTKTWSLQVWRGEFVHKSPAHKDLLAETISRGRLGERDNNDFSLSPHALRKGGKLHEKGRYLKSATDHGEVTRFPQLTEVTKIYYQAVFLAAYQAYG